MPRQATAADQELIDYAAQFGYEVTPRKLERWRQAGALPPRVRPGRGRGRGRASLNPPHAGTQLVLLCKMLRGTRRLREATLWVWYFGGDVSIDLIKHWAVECIRGYEQTRERIRQELVHERASMGVSEPPDNFDIAEREAVEATRRLPRGERLSALAAAERLKADGDDQPPSGREALVSIRTQMSQVFAGDEEVEPHIGALAASMKFDLLDRAEGRPSELSEAELANTLPHMSATNLIAEVTRASEDELLEVRDLLRHNYDLVQALRKSPSEPMRQQGDATDVFYDPRDPEYREKALLVGLATALVLLRLETSVE